MKLVHKYVARGSWEHNLICSRTSCGCCTRPQERFDAELVVRASNAPLSQRMAGCDKASGSKCLTGMNLCREIACCPVSQRRPSCRLIGLEEDYSAAAANFFSDS